MSTNAKKTDHIHSDYNTIKDDVLCNNLTDRKTDLKPTLCYINKQHGCQITVHTTLDGNFLIYLGYPLYHTQYSMTHKKAQFVYIKHHTLTYVNRFS